MFNYKTVDNSFLLHLNQKNIMENKDLERLPDPNTFEHDICYLSPVGTRYPITVYYKHRFINEKGIVTKHWSKKESLPENATLNDL